MDGTLRIERVALLGLVTLLGATGSLVAAIAALVVSAVAALVVWASDLALRKVAPVSPAARWGLIFAIGFAISWLLAAPAYYAVPISDRALLFLRLAGVSPIVFYSAAAKVTGREVMVSWAWFAVLIVATGAVRELLGRGTLFGYLVTGGFTVPADFFASSMGAFLVVATVILGARIAAGIAAGNAAGVAGRTGEER